MGTRHLTCVVLDGQFKVAQYGQWDGYPSGQGVTVLTFLHSVDLDRFRSLVSELKEISEDDLKAKWVECGAEPNAEWVTMDVSGRMKQRYPWLSRDCGAEVLNHIANGSCKEVKLDVGFAADSLFCEWAYVIDLDANTLEVYQGFQTDPHNKGRFASENQSDGYYPVALRQTHALDALPSVDEFTENLATAE